jgi:hypothetical protein
MKRTTVDTLFGASFELCSRLGFESFVRGRRGPDLRVQSGPVAICEPIWPKGKRVALTEIEPGAYPTYVSVVEERAFGAPHFHLAAARLDLSDRRAVKWKAKGSVVADAASVAFIDAGLSNDDLNEEGAQSQIQEGMRARDNGFAFLDGRVVAFHLDADGRYPIYDGIDEGGRVVSLMVCFEELSRKVWESAECPVGTLGPIDAPLLRSQRIQVEGLDVWKSKKIDVRSSWTIKVHSQATTISNAHPVVEIIDATGQPVRVETDVVPFKEGRFQLCTCAAGFPPGWRARFSIESKRIKI